MRAVGLLLLVTVASACESSAPRVRPTEAATGVVPAATPPTILSGPSPDTVIAVIVSRIGRLEGDEAYLFGAITSVAETPSGVVYVADRIGASVRAFDSTGVFVGWVGREGDGPKEFRWPNDILVEDDDRIYIRSATRVAVWTTREGSALADSVLETWALPGFANLDSRRARMVGGIYHYPHYVARTDAPMRFNYLRFSGEGFTGDTLWVPSFANLDPLKGAGYMVSRSSGRQLTGLSHVPFAPLPSWDLTAGGEIVTTDGASSELVVFDTAGDTVRTHALARPARRPIGGGERADSLRALEARLDSIPVPLSEVINLPATVAAKELPDSTPSARAVHVGAGDRIWVERWPAEGDAERSIYDLFSARGDYLRTVILPLPLLRDPPPWFGRGVILGVVRDPTTDVQTVVRLRFTDPDQN